MMRKGMRKKKMYIKRDLEHKKEKELFSKRLQALRKEKGMTQEEVASYLNYHCSAISNYETRSKNIPSFYDLKKLAKLFDVSIDYLVCLTDERLPFANSPLYREVKQLCNIGVCLKNPYREKLLSFAQWVLYQQHYDEVIYSSRKKYKRRRICKLYIVKRPQKDYQ